MTRLNQLARSASLDETERAAIRQTLEDVFPRQISRYLFETDGKMRLATFDVRPLRDLIVRHRADIVTSVSNSFQQGWPAADADVTSDDALAAHVDGMAESLSNVLLRLRRRLQ